MKQNIWQEHLIVFREDLFWHYRIPIWSFLFSVSWHSRDLTLSFLVLSNHGQLCELLRIASPMSLSFPKVFVGFSGHSLLGLRVFGSCCGVLCYAFGRNREGSSHCSDFCFNRALPCPRLLLEIRAHNGNLQLGHTSTFRQLMEFWQTHHRMKGRALSPHGKHPILDVPHTPRDTGRHWRKCSIEGSVSESSWSERRDQRNHLRQWWPAKARTTIPY